MTTTPSPRYNNLLEEGPSLETLRVVRAYYQKLIDQGDVFTPIPYPIAVVSEEQYRLFFLDPAP